METVETRETRETRETFEDIAGSNGYLVVSKVKIGSDIISKAYNPIGNIVYILNQATSNGLEVPMDLEGLIQTKSIQESILDYSYKKVVESAPRKSILGIAIEVCSDSSANLIVLKDSSEQTYALTDVPGTWDLYPQNVDGNPRCIPSHHAIPYPIISIKDLKRDDLRRDDLRRDDLKRDDLKREDLRRENRDILIERVDEVVGYFANLTNSEQMEFFSELLDGVVLLKSKMEEYSRISLESSKILRQRIEKLLDWNSDFINLNGDDDEATNIHRIIFHNLCLRNDNVNDLLRINASVLELNSGIKNALSKVDEGLRLFQSQFNNLDKKLVNVKVDFDEMLEEWIAKKSAVK